MTQAERDRLVALKKAKKKLITQKEAAEELGITERHVRRLLGELKRRGDQAVVHALRGLPSNRKIGAERKQEAVAILSRPVYRGFGPTLASEYLTQKHGLEVNRETVRQWMMEAKLWRARKQRVEKIHGWRPLAYYTDKAALFQTAEKTKRGEWGAGKDPVELPPTQIGRALQELGITWRPPHSPQAKGRVERGFSTAQDRLVKGLRVAGVTTRERANHYLETEFLPWCHQTIAVAPLHADDAHRPLEKHHDLAAILSQVESRHVNNDYTIQFETQVYQILRQDICAGLRCCGAGRETPRWFYCRLLS